VHKSNPPKRADRDPRSGKPPAPAEHGTQEPHPERRQQGQALDSLTAMDQRARHWSPKHEWSEDLCQEMK